MLNLTLFTSFTVPSSVVSLSVLGVYLGGGGGVFIVVKGGSHLGDKSTQSMRISTAKYIIHRTMAE